MSDAGGSTAASCSAKPGALAGLPDINLAQVGSDPGGERPAALAADGGTPGTLEGDSIEREHMFDDGPIRQTCSSERSPPFSVSSRANEAQRRRSEIIIAARKEGNATSKRKRPATIAELAEEVLDGSGVLVDCIARNRRRRRGNKSAARDREKEIAALAKIINALAINNWADFQYAGLEISLEHLQMVIMTAITREAKSRGTWPNMNAASSKLGGHTLSYEMMRFRANQIRMWKQKELCLCAEVENWMFRYKLLNSTVTPEAEDMWDRKERLAEFWTTYRERKGMPIEEMEQQQRRLQQQQVSRGAEAPRTATSTRDEAPSRPTSDDAAGRMQSPALSNTGRISTRQSGEHLPQLDPRSGPQKADGLRAGFRSNSSLPSLTSGKPRSGGSAGKAAKRTMASTGESWGGHSHSSSLPNLRGGVNKYTTQKTATRHLAELSAISPASTFRGEAARQPLLQGHGKRYLRECDSQQRLPIPLVFNTGHSKKFEAAGRDLVDQDLIAIAGMMRDTNVLEVADLSNNSLLTDAGLVPFLQELSHRPLVLTLQQLLLSNCLRAGVRCMKGIMKLLGHTPRLRKLDLSHVPLSMQLQEELCKAIGSHERLETVNLTDTGINSRYVSKQCLGELLSSDSIINLDLSWNCFTSEWFLCLGEEVVKNSCLRTLTLTNCSATVEGKDTPISLFLECLSRDTSLVKLDISMNRIDHETFLIVEDSCHSHPKLQELIVSHNPLGMWGIRSALRLMSRDTNDLTKLQLEGCFSGLLAGNADQKESSFSASSPGGKYTLNLERPCRRAVLRMLYRITDMFGLVPDEAFSSLSYIPHASKDAPKSYAHPPKEPNGLRSVPTLGTLVLVLNVQRCIEKKITGLEDDDFDGFFVQYFQLMRYHLNWKKAVPILCNWKLLLAGSMTQQGVYLDSLAKDFCLEVHHLGAMCAINRLFAKDTICRIMPLVPHDAASRFLSHMKVPSMGDFLWTHHYMQNLLNFNVGNPTGHYKLDLENCCDYAVAERLCLLDRWESIIDLRRQFFDTSKLGNRSHFRNEEHRGHKILSLGVASMAEWTLPESGDLEFDYNTNRRPKSSTTPVSDENWDHILVTLYDSRVNEDAIIKVLRRISHNLVLTSLQMRTMLGYFKTEEERAECFVMFFFRVYDIYNAKIFSSRFSDQAEINKLQERLGYVSFFPFVQPENMTFSLDLSFHDQRVCGSLLISMAIKENANNVRGPKLIFPDGREDSFSQGLPPSWQNPDKMPKEGVFTCQYVCSPDCRKYQVRRQNAETYGYYTVDAEEADVQWWTGLMEVPDDVLKFMEWMMYHYPGTEQVFMKIDGKDGNGEITLMELSDGLKRINFNKFEGKDAQARTEGLFRYLDPGGEGTISKGEWKIFDQLWREFETCVREFVHFLMLAFGTDLAAIWQILDTSQDGELSMDEWTSAMEDIGYFGPAHIVYRLLDHSDDGLISYEEFTVLQKYAPSSGQEAEGVAGES